MIRYFDGGMGTLLQKAGLPAVDLKILKQPDIRVLRTVTRFLPYLCSAPRINAADRKVFFPAFGVTEPGIPFKQGLPDCPLKNRSLVEHSQEFAF